MANFDWKKEDLFSLMEEADLFISSALGREAYTVDDFNSWLLESPEYREKINNDYGRVCTAIEMLGLWASAICSNAHINLGSLYSIQQLEEKLKKPCVYALRTCHTIGQATYAYREILKLVSSNKRDPDQPISLTFEQTAFDILTNTIRKVEQRTEIET